MSGIEILGIAASVIQIADLGGKLSVKLFTFSRKIKNAHKSIDSISQDIAATGAILQQLGNELKKDEQLRLCSQEAVSTARSLVDECNKIFVDLNSALDGGKSQTQGSRLILSWKDRLKFSFLEPQIDLLRANLERLKSSLAVMLNVMIFAEQLRNQEALPILKEQRELIKILVEDKEATQKRFEQVLRAIGDAETSEEPLKPALDNHATREIPNQPTQNSSVLVTEIKQDQKLVNVEPVLVPPLPVGILQWKDEIEHHSALVKSLLDVASASHYNIDHGQRYRMHEGILHVHWEEWSRLREMYNNETLLRAFSSRHPVSRFWQSQLEREVVSFKYEDSINDEWVGGQAGPDLFTENLPQYPGLPIMKDTTGSYAEVVENSSAPPPCPPHNSIHDLQTASPPGLQSLAAPALLSPSSPAISPQDRMEIRASSDPVYDDSDEDSVDALFSIPLSKKRSTSPSLDKVSRPTLSVDADSLAKNVRYGASDSPRGQPVPPGFLVDVAQQSVQPPYTSSRTSMGALGRVRADIDYTHVLYSDERQFTVEDEEEEEDAMASTVDVTFRKQEPVLSTRNALTAAAVPKGTGHNLLSRAGAESMPLGVAGVAPMPELEKAFTLRSNLSISNAAVKGDQSESKVVPAAISRPQMVQRVKTSESAMSSFLPKFRTTLAERAKYQFEADSEDDEMEDEINANMEELNAVAGRLNLLARATRIEVEGQNYLLQRISMKSDRLDGGNSGEVEVVDDLLSRWTNLPKSHLERARNENLAQNTQRLNRIH